MKIIKSQNFSNAEIDQASPLLPLTGLLRDKSKNPATQQTSPTIGKFKQIKQLLDEIGGEMQAETDEAKKEEMSNWVMELRRTLDSML
jgi:hypothetical protein